MVFLLPLLLVRPFPGLAFSVGLQCISPGPFLALFPLPQCEQGHPLCFRGLSYYP